MADNRSAVSKGLYRWREPKWRPAFPAHARPPKTQTLECSTVPQKGDGAGAPPRRAAPHNQPQRERMRQRLVDLRVYRSGGHMRSVFVMTVAATLVAANSVAAQTTSAPPAAAPAPSAPATGAPALAPTPGTPSPGGVTQMPSPSVNSTPSQSNVDLYILPPVFYPIRRRAQGRPAQPHQGRSRPAGLHRGGRRREQHREVGPTTEILSEPTPTTA